MRRLCHSIYWILTCIILTLTFRGPYGGLAHSFYFVAFLFPVVVGTSYLLTSHLVPRFLFRKAYFRFALYFVYTIVFSVYLEMLAMTLALILFANFQYSVLNPKTTDIVFLTIVLYFFVFLNTVIFLIREHFRGEEKRKELEMERELYVKGYLTVRSERKKCRIPFAWIEYVESLGNYVRITSSSGETTLTKEKLSTLMERLPDTFIRIHRSIVVNRDKIQSFNREMVTLEKTELPISRKYKNEATASLSQR